MKLLFVVDSFGGGAGNVIQILASSFRDRGFDVSILLLNGKIVEPKYNLRGIKIIDCPLGKYAAGKTPIDRVIKSVRTIRYILKRKSPDVIISFLTENNILCCMANRWNVPMIISERNDPSKEKLKKYWQVLRRLYYKRANKIVVQCSNFVGFAGGRYKDKVSVIPNPILKPDRTKDSVELHNPIKLVSVGRLMQQKNFEWMIKRMAELFKVFQSFSLHIYGSGEKEAELLDLIQSYDLSNNVKLMGYTDRPYEVLSECDIYLMSSDYEGFPNALSEAMALGLPSVSRICHEGLRDLVSDGINGYLVGMDDAEGFNKSIIRLVEDSNLRTRMSNAAKTVSDTYGKEKVCDMWEECIDTVLFLAKMNKVKTK